MATMKLSKLPTTSQRPVCLARGPARLSSGASSRSTISRSTPEGSSGPSVDTAEAAPQPATSRVESPSSVLAAAEGARKRQKRQAESTDAISTFLTRRFGIAGGLAWLGFLAVGSLGEQIKTRLEVAAEESGTRDVEGAEEVVLPSGVRYRDLRVGGGQAPGKGMLVVVDYSATANGAQFESTRERRKPIVYLYGSRPFTGGMCAGVEQALSSMRAGGRRVITVPAELGFGERGAMLRPTEHVPEKQGLVPPGAELVYDLELLRVSVPPS